MIYIKKLKKAPNARVTIGSDKSDNQVVLLTDDDIGALADAFGFVWSPDELREPIDAALDVLSEALRDRSLVDDPGYFTAIEAGTSNPLKV